MIPVLLLQLLSGAVLFTYSESKDGFKWLKYNPLWPTDCCHAEEKSESCCSGETTCESSCIASCCTTHQLFTIQNFEQTQETHSKKTTRITENKLVSVHSFSSYFISPLSHESLFETPSYFPRIQSQRDFRCVWNC